MWAKNYLLNTFKVMGVSKSAKQAKLRPLLVNYFQLADYFELKRELLSLSLSCPGLVLNQYYWFIPPEFILGSTVCLIHETHGTKFEIQRSLVTEFQCDLGRSLSLNLPVNGNVDSSFQHSLQRISLNEPNIASESYRPKLQSKLFWLQTVCQTVHKMCSFFRFKIFCQS